MRHVCRVRPGSRRKAPRARPGSRLVTEAISSRSTSSEASQTRATMSKGTSDISARTWPVSSSATTLPTESRSRWACRSSPADTRAPCPTQAPISTTADITAPSRTGASRSLPAPRRRGFRPPFRRGHDTEPDDIYFAHGARPRSARIRSGVTSNISLGRLVTGSYIQATDSYAFVEKIADIHHDRSDVYVEIGYELIPGLSVRGLGTGFYTHGGLIFKNGASIPDALFPHHDQIDKSSAINLGGGLSYQLTGSLELYASYLTTVQGRGGHKLDRGLGFGATWNFSPSNSFDSIFPRSRWIRREDHRDCCSLRLAGVHGASADAGAVAPDFVMRTLDGRRFSLAETEKTHAATVVLFISTICPVFQLLQRPDAGHGGGARPEGRGVRGDQLGNPLKASKKSGRTHLSTATPSTSSRIPPAGPPSCSPRAGLPKPSFSMRGGTLRYHGRIASKIVRTRSEIRDRGNACR